MQTQITIFYTIIGSFFSMGLATGITVWANRKKNKAEANFLTVETYSLIAADLRALITQQGEQLRAQAAQIQNLQNKEVEYLKIIGQYQLTESELKGRVRELEDNLHKLQIKIA